MTEEKVREVVQLMIDNKYAISYGGGKKETPTEWLEDL